MQGQCNKAQHKGNPSKSTLSIEELISTAELDSAGTPPCLGIRENVLEIPQNISVPLHVEVQFCLITPALELHCNSLEGLIRLAPCQCLPQTRVDGLAVGLAVLILPTGLRETSGDELLVDDGCEGNLLERAEGELVVQAERGYMDVAAAGEILLRVEMDPHSFPEVGECAGDVHCRVELGGDNFHTDCGWLVSEAGDEGYV